MSVNASAWTWWARTRRPIAALAIIGCIIGVRFNAAGLAGAPEFGLPQTFIFPGNDLVVYLKAGQALLDGATPYTNTPWPDPAVYHYSPAAAWFIAQIMRLATLLAGALPFRLLAYLHLALIVGALPLAWLVWRAALRELLPGSTRVMAAWLPLWLVYSQWFADQNFLNIYTFLIVLSGALMLAVARERTWIAVALAVLILQTKPHYAFPIVLPLLLGRWRYFAKLLLATVAAYALVAGITILAVGPAYGVTLYGEYLRFLTSIAQNYPWGSYYLGYNHSWYSILHWLFGIQSWTPAVVAFLKIATFAPLGWLTWEWLRRRPADRATGALGLTFALHLWSMTLLDQLWEASLAIVAFMYLLAAGSARVRRLSILAGVPFALLGLMQLAGWKLAAVIGRSIDQLDITAQIPVIMAAVLGLYALLVWTVKRSIPRTLTGLAGLPDIQADPHTLR